jgi:hypothetical protein
MVGLLRWQTNHKASTIDIGDNRRDKNSYQYGGEITGLRGHNTFYQKDRI